MRVDSALLVFARAPVAGQVKTRLIPALGPVGAAELHARLVHHTLKSAVAAAIGQVRLCCTPDEQHPFFEQCAREFGVALQVQQGNDLGRRMAHALACALNDKRQALLIGTDCPCLSPDILRIAARGLNEEVDAVFVPAEDGGYALVGMRQAIPAIFEGIAWGTSAVMAQTRRHLQRLSLNWHELPALNDVDTPDDLALLQRTHPELLNGI